MYNFVNQITEISEVGLAYLPGNATRIKVKAVGNLRTDIAEQSQTEKIQISVEDSQAAGTGLLVMLGSVRKKLVITRLLLES